MHHDGRAHALHLPEGSAGRVRGRPRQHLAPEARLGGRLHDEASVHAHVPHSPRGSLERRRAGHGAGLRLHRPGDPGAATRAVHPAGTPSRCAACAPSTRRRSGSSCAPASPAGAASSGPSSRATLSRARTLRGVWTDGIDNPKTGAPIGSGPFLVERWERGTRIVLRRNPNYWGRRPRLERLVIRYRMSSLDPADWFRSGEVDVAQHFARRRRLAGGARSPDRARALVELGAPHARTAAPAATPHSRRRRSARRSRTASTGSPSSGTARSALRSRLCAR